MHNRLQNRILAWWNSNNNGIRDNGILGIDRLNADFSPRASPNTYYFTMSFDATKPFPQENLSGQDLRDLPVNPVLSFFRLYPGLANVTANAASFTSSVVHGLFSSIPGNPSDIGFAQWAVVVINNHASALGYQVRIPRPGGRIPREDMLPVLSIFSLGMSGVEAPFGSSEKNDGVVDTASMCGPADNLIRDSVDFDAAVLASNRGVYWHFGETEGIDHADQVGVFTDPVTVSSLSHLNNQGSVWMLIAAKPSTVRFCRCIGILENLFRFFLDLTHVFRGLCIQPCEFSMPHFHCASISLFGK
jgi:hypothetical protein